MAFIHLSAIVIFSFILMIISGNQNTALAAVDTFYANGQISSLIFGMNPSTDIVNMRSVQKFILSGNWALAVDKGRLVNFTSEFYTGPIDGANNHTHQFSNFRPTTVVPIHLSPYNKTQISGIINIGTNGKSVWNDVNATITISNERTISIKLDDKDSQNHFMNQLIYGIVRYIMTK